MASGCVLNYEQLKNNTFMNITNSIKEAKIQEKISNDAAKLSSKAAKISADAAAKAAKAEAKIVKEKATS